MKRTRIKFGFLFDLGISLKNSVLSGLFICFLGSQYMAQDIHFSQFDNSPLNLNPANTGVLEGDYRLGINHKSQWNSVSFPYSTYSFAYDMSLLKDPSKNSYFGFGLLAYTDKAGTSDFKNSLYAASLSSTIKMDDSKNLSFGLQVGYGQKSVRYENLTWDSQFLNGAFDSNLPTGELGNGNQVKYADVSAGIALNGNKEKVQYQFGGAYFHINQPNISFIGLEEKKLSGKIVVHGKMRFQLQQADNRPTAYIVPKLLYLRQGGHQEINAGIMYEYIIQGAAKYTTYQNEVKIGLGAYYRLGDAFILATSLDYGHIMIGISYDVNTSKLSAASSYRGGIEVALIFKNVFNSSLIKLKKQ